MSIQDSSEWRPRIPADLGPELAETLCLLQDAPSGAAESTLALLPHDSRSDLAAHGILDAQPAEDAEAAEIRITPYGWRLISSP